MSQASDPTWWQSSETLTAPLPIHRSTDLGEVNSASREDLAVCPQEREDRAMRIWPGLIDVFEAARGARLPQPSWLDAGPTLAA